MAAGSSDTRLKRARTSPARSYMSASSAASGTSTVWDRQGAATPSGVEAAAAATEEKQAALQVAEETGVEPTTIGAVGPSPKVEYSRGRRWFLLLVFCLASVGFDPVTRLTAQFLDISCRSGVVLFTQQISKDLDIVYESSTWVIVGLARRFIAE